MGSASLAILFYEEQNSNHHNKLQIFLQLQVMILHILWLVCSVSVLISLGSDQEI
jgi:hypothetical protein